MTTRRFQQTTGKFVVAGAVVAFVIYFLGGHLWRDISIALHGQHTRGIVTGWNRGALLYHYTVNGHDYSGSGRGDYTRVYPNGSEVDVRYSSVHPSFSTIDELFLFEKQLLCGAAIFGGFFLIIYWSRRRHKAAQQGATAHDDGHLHQVRH